MRNVLRRKPLHRLLLSAAIASLIAAPAAFATSHNNSSASGRNSGHSSARHHTYADAGRSGKRVGHRANRNSQSVAESSQQRRHMHVPDEEELAQPEL